MPRSTWDRYALDLPMRRSTSRRESWWCMRAHRKTLPTCGRLCRSVRSGSAEGREAVDLPDALSIIVFGVIVADGMPGAADVVVVRFVVLGRLGKTRFPRRQDPSVTLGSRRAQVPVPHRGPPATVGPAVEHGGGTVPDIGGGVPNGESAEAARAGPLVGVRRSGQSAALNGRSIPCDVETPGREAGAGIRTLGSRWKTGRPASARAHADAFPGRALSGGRGGTDGLRSRQSDRGLRWLTIAKYIRTHAKETRKRAR